MFVCAWRIPDELGFSLALRCSIKDYVLDYAETPMGLFFQPRTPLSLFVCKSVKHRHDVFFRVIK